MWTDKHWWEISLVAVYICGVREERRGETILEMSDLTVLCPGSRPCHRNSASTLLKQPARHHPLLLLKYEGKSWNNKLTRFIISWPGHFYSRRIKYVLQYLSFLGVVVLSFFFKTASICKVLQRLFFCQIKILLSHCPN